MKLVGSFPFLAFALVLLAIVGYGIASGSVGLMLVAGVLAVLSRYVTEGPRGRTLPQWVSNLLLVAVVLHLAVDYMQHHRLDEVMHVLGRFTIWLTVIKLYDRKTPRDYGQLLALSLVMMVTASLLSSELMFGAVLLIYAALGLYVLVLFQLYSAHEAARTARRTSAPRGYRLVPAVQPILGRRVGLEFRTLVVFIALAGLTFSGVIFVSIPRGVGRGAVSQIAGRVTERRVGFGDGLNPTHAGRITDSRRHVLTLQARTPDGTPQRLPEPVLLRGAVYDVYEGEGEWATSRPLQSRRKRTIDTSADAFTSLASSGAAIQGPVHELFFDWSIDHGVAFSIYAPVAISTDDPHRFEYDPRMQTLDRVGSSWLGEYVVRYQSTPNDETSRAIQHLTGFRGGPSFQGDRALLGKLTDHARQLLEDAGLARLRPRGWEERWTWSRNAARVFESHLESDEFSYTLDLSDVTLRDGVDPIAQFVLETKRGHCEYFASGFVLMCQLVGIEARAVSGYLAYQYDDDAKAYHVVDGNAHAWAEVRTGDYRWEPYDPTPPASIAEHHLVEETIVAQFRRFFDGIESRWDRDIAAFDRDTQTRMRADFDAGWSRKLTDFWSSTQEWAQEINRSFYLGPAGYIWLGTVGMLLLAVIIVVVHLIRRARRMRRALSLGHLSGAEYRLMLRRLGFYLDMLGILRRGKLEKPYWRPPGAHADVVAETRPDAAEIVTRLTGLFYRVRYGGRDLEDAEIEVARTDVRKLATLLRVRA